MLLRVSGEMTGQVIDVGGIVSDDVRLGLDHDETLNALVEATLGVDDDALEQVRSTVIEQMGATSLVDAAGVIANFMQMDRIADGTGIPLDKPFVEASAGVRAELGIDSMDSAANTPGISVDT